MEVRDEEKKRVDDPSASPAAAAAVDHRPRKRRHGSTALFVAVDYVFLLIFFCFLCYFLFKIWPLRSAPLSST